MQQYKIEKSDLTFVGVTCGRRFGGRAGKGRRPCGVTRRREVKDLPYGKERWRAKVGAYIHFVVMRPYGREVSLKRVGDGFHTVPRQKGVRVVV